MKSTADVIMLYKGKYRVESTRLESWDYSSPGYYFVTICVQNRDCHFGNVENGSMVLSDIGEIANKYWQEIPLHIPSAQLDEYIIMPNHVHGIIIQNEIRRNTTSDSRITKKSAVRQGGITAHHNPMLAKNGIPYIIRWYKGRVAHEIRKNIVALNNIQFAWQPRFHDHIIRSEEDLNKIRNYISSNPVNWDKDEENQDAINRVSTAIKNY